MSFQHLQKRAEFIAASKSPHVWKRPAFVLQLRLNNGEKFPRIGFTVTKKQGNAVLRNRVKRRLREAVRLHLMDLLQPGRDYVFIGRTVTATMPFEKLCNEMRESVSRLHHKVDKHSKGPNQ
jgi:ribonuclease P protein component